MYYSTLNIDIYVAEAAQEQLTIRYTITMTLHYVYAFDNSHLLLVSSSWLKLLRDHTFSAPREQKTIQSPGYM